MEKSKKYKRVLKMKRKTFRNSKLIENIAKRIAPLFHFDISTMYRFISALKKKQSLLEFYNRLPTINMANRNMIGEGMFGQIKSNISNDFVLKQIPLSKSSLHNAMLEAFVHSILSTDSYIQTSICVIYGIYQSPGLLVLQLEKLPITFDNYIKEEKSVNKILDCFKELVSLILYTQRTYVFQHCDLNYNNIMIKDGHIKLIDFGLGRMILGTHIYMPDGEEIQDLDFDLLKIFSQLTLCDPLSDEVYEMVIKSTNEKTLLDKIESFKTTE